MDGPMLASLVALLGSMLLVGAGLRSRSLGGEPLVRMALVWTAIILAVWAAVTIGLNLHHNFT